MRRYKKSFNPEKRYETGSIPEASACPSLNNRAGDVHMLPATNAIHIRYLPAPTTVLGTVSC
jgi:hypothetical protein